MKRNKRQSQPKGAPLWMVTFSDLMTLILVFFILLFSMSQIDMIKFKAVVESFNKDVVFDFYPSVIPFENPAEKAVQITDSEPIEDVPREQLPNANENEGSEEGDQLGQLLKEVNEYLETQGLMDVISANRSERGVVLVLQEKVLFKSGNAVIINDAKPFLDKVGTLLKNIPNPVKIEGHTDDRPISTSKFPSNWELSAARSSSVIRYLVTEHDLKPRRFTGNFYGETRPIVPNNNSENWATNRRVEIVISDPNFTQENE